MGRSGRIVLLVILAAGAIGALVTGERVYSRLLASGLVLLSVTWLWSATSLWGLRLTRAARSLKASVGDLLEENFELSNTSRLPRLWVEVINTSPIADSAGSRLFTLLRGRQRRFYLSRTRLTRRGAFPLGPTILKAGDPFGIFTRRQIIPSKQTLIVLPMLVEVADFPSPPAVLPGGQVIRRKAVGITPHAAGVRDYVAGDPMKAIHWPSTARRGRLMVKEFEQDPQAETWIFLDAEARVHHELPAEEEAHERLDELIFRRRHQTKLQPATIEYGVTLAASLAHYFIQRGRTVGFISSAQALTVIPPERGKRQEGKLLETLAFIQAAGQLPIAALAAAQARSLPLGSTVILITPSLRHEIGLAAEEMQHRSHHPIVLLLDPASFGGGGLPDSLKTALVARGVPVCLIHRGDDLPSTLAAFARDAIGNSRVLRTRDAMRGAAWAGQPGGRQPGG